MGARATRRIRANWRGVSTANKSLKTSRPWVGARLGDTGQDFARPTDIRSHGSKVQTLSRQAGPKGPDRQSTTTPTFPRGSAADLGDLICVLAFHHVHQLALAGADKAALLRPHPSNPFRRDLRAEL